METMVIGTAKLVEAHTFRNQYETAAWFQDVAVEAGVEVEIRADVQRNRNPEHPDGYAVGAVCGFGSCWWGGLKGTITDEYFAGLWCGVPIGPYAPRNIGKPGEAQSRHSYAYQLAEAVVEDGGRMGPWQITLDPALVEVQQFLTAHKSGESVMVMDGAIRKQYLLLPAGAPKPRIKHTGCDVDGCPHRGEVLERSTVASHYDYYVDALAIPAAVSRHPGDNPHVDHAYAMVGA